MSNNIGCVYNDIGCGTINIGYGRGVGRGRGGGCGCGVGCGFGGGGGRGRGRDDGGSCGFGGKIDVKCSLLILKYIINVITSIIVNI